MSAKEVVIATLHLPMQGHTFTHLMGAMVDALEGEGWTDVVMVATDDTHRPQIAATPPWADEDDAPDTTQETRSA